MLVTVNPSLSVDPNLRGFGHRMAFSGLWPGLGAEPTCPTYAPYKNSYGNCTNIAPITTAPASGGGNTGTNYLAYNDPASPYYQKPEYLPAGYVANPWTGKVEAASQYADTGALETSQADAQAEAQAAVAAGAARGVPVVCSVYQNLGTPGYASLFGASCTVAGSGEYDAGLLLRSGGIESALMESGRAAGTPYTSVPRISPALTWGTTPAPTPTPVPAPTAQAAASTATGKPNQSVPPRDTSVPMPTGGSSTGARLSAAYADGTKEVTEATGLDSTTLLIGAAAIAAYFLFLKK